MADHSAAESLIIAPFARRWRAARRVYVREGAVALLAELLYQIGKPAIVACDWARWRWLRIRGRKTFRVMGHQMTVLPQDPGVSRELAVHNVHEPLASRLLHETLKAGMNVVDIGSNIGYYALLEARLIGSQGKVFAIEPMKENAAQLAVNIEANGYENVLIHEIGIANRNGTADINVSAKSNWHSLNPVPWPTQKRSVTVSTLDDLLRRYAPAHVDLVRMDLEGYEIVVIKGMRWTLRKYRPRLLVELHPHLVGSGAIIEYLRALEDLGYGAEWLIEQERDVPIRWRFMKVETPTMSDLMNDPRICRDPRSLTVLFSTERGESASARPEPSAGRPELAERPPQRAATSPRHFPGAQGTSAD